MESTISYIIIATIAILSVVVYNFKKKQTRIYLLSSQQFPELILNIKIEKHLGKIVSIIINIDSLKDLIIRELKVELISSKRVFNYYPLEELAEIEKLPIHIKQNSNIDFKVSFDSFTSLLKDGDHPFRTYRFVVVSENGVSYKSHELGFNKKWVIYRPDSGSYN